MEIQKEKGKGKNSKKSSFASRERQNKDSTKEIFEKVVSINRCAKAAKGGRKFSFSALIVSGDKNGKVGYGFGKANEISSALSKASERSQKNMIRVSIINGTIPHKVQTDYSGAKVLLKPASRGTGIIAGGGVRAVCEAVGIKDVLSKSLGSNNPINVVKATFSALSSIKSRSEVNFLRGKK